MDDKLEICIGASRYKHFNKRVKRFPDDRSNYRQSSGDLKEFIRLCPWETECLYQYSSMSSKGIVEIGRFNGGSALLFSLSNPSVDIVSIDIAPQDDRRLEEIFKKLDTGSNVRLVVDDASSFSRSSAIADITFDFLFIDGDHSYEGCLADIQNFYPHLQVGGLVVFHDSYPRLPVNGVFQAILDFCAVNPGMQAVLPPVSSLRVWENQNGSLSIFRKTI